MGLSNKELILKEGVLLQNLSNETIILDVKTGKYFEVNEVGRKIISLIQETKYTPESLISHIKNEVVSDNIEKDVKNFLQQLHDLKILEVVE